MTPQELKASILQLAIQGKLVPQIPEEGTGEELHQQIQAEKQRLIKVGTIKKEKSLPEIAEDEVPFDIPETWTWVRLGDCSGYAQTKEKVAATDITGNMWSLDLEDIQKETGAIVTQTKASERKITGDKVRFYKGQVLYSKLRPYLKKILVAPADGICTPELVPFDAYLVDANYLVCVLRSPHIDFVVNSVTYGVKMPRVGTDTMVNLLIPLPPLAEQKRIVAKIEELLPLIGRYEQAWSRLEDFNKRFPVDMQKSILQMAIQGKLVPQLPEEGTGEELFQQIQAEKQRLIKSGTIKKEKPLPEITEDEIPFDIPESWKWVRVGDYVQKVTDYVASGSFASLRENVKIYKEPNYAILVKTKDFQSNFTNDLTYTDKHGYEFLENSRLFGGELIMPNIGASIGKVFKVPYLDAKMTLAPNSVLIRFISEEHLDWFSYYFTSPIGFAQLKAISASTAQAKFSKTEFKGLLIPVPPLAEQKRIVAKLEEILPLCERLK